MDPRQSRITELAIAIKKQTEILQSLLDSLKVDTPSFSVNANQELPRNAAVQLAQSSILDSCTELQDLVEGPLGHVGRIMSPRVHISSALQAIVHFNIAGKIAKHETVSFGEIAKRCKMNVDDVKRIMRLAISYRIFKESHIGFVNHTASSFLIAENLLVRQWISLCCDEFIPAGSFLVPAMKKWPNSEEPNETAFALLHKGDSLWDVLKKQPEKAQRFAHGMEYMRTLPPFDIKHLFTSLNWEIDCETVLVDVGGSQGSIAEALLRRYPRLRCYVQDLPETLSKAVVPKDLKGRLEFVSHSIFKEQPIKADVYLLRSILHDWLDGYALQIIRNLIPALEVGSKVIINEICLPEPNAISTYEAQLIRGYDLSMKQQFNSKERDVHEWEALFRLADRRFKLNRIVNPPGSFLAVLEFEWQPMAP
jgi:hypothetical protein